MGFDTSGFVLKSARSAPSNATSTAAADSGVLREHKNLPGTYDLPGTLVEVAADQYRAAVLLNSDTTQEYLLWAANSSNLAVLEDASWSIDQGSGSIPRGTLTFTIGPTTYTDGTDRIIVGDDDGRSIASVLSVTVLRGDTRVSTTFTSSDFSTQDADAGVVVLDSAAVAVVGGGLSQARGDTITRVTYYLAAQKFWWTRNDGELARFGWNGLTQRWEPYKGAPPVSLGQVLSDGSYTLTPHPSRFTVGDYLPGDPSNPHSHDRYAMVRVGTRPDAQSEPVRVLVVSDAAAASAYSFPVGVDAVVGVTSGFLQWNPLSLASFLGRVAWYIPETYHADATGDLGPLLGSDTNPLFLTPIPGIQEYPLLRFGSRRYLTAVMADSDADLAVLSVAEGQVGWSQTTGILKFSSADVAKADPDDAGFSLLYLGARVVCDGVSLTSVPVGTRAPVQVVDGAGTPTTVDATKTLYIPESAPLPSPGVSGVMLVPDGSGVVPNGTAVPGTRPNGSGLVRAIDVAGDVFLFGRPGAVETLEVVEFESDLPTFSFQVPAGRGFAARELGAAGSKMMLGRKDRLRFDGEPLYFVQAMVQPASYARYARVISRVREPFVFDGTETFAFAIDGVNYQWNAPAGTQTAAVVAAALDALVTGSGSVTTLDGRVVISAGDLDTGSVEIGFGSSVSGTFAARSLAGCAVLGFMPGWRVANPVATSNWLPDAGLAFGVARSPLNLDRSQAYADFQARGRFSDAILSRSVVASPVFLLTNPPLLDVAGYDEGIFFQTIDGAYRRSLAPFEDVLYEFDSGRFSWLETGALTSAVTAATSSLSLEATGVVGATLHPSVGSGYGFYVDSQGAPFVLQTLGEDFLLDEAPGTATLIEKFGGLVVTGAQGSFASGGVTLTDPEATFVSSGVSAGYRLKIVGGALDVRGSYIVHTVVGETTLTIASSVPFPAAGSLVSWEIYEGLPDTVYDPSLVADVVYETFNHLPTEPFQVRVLSDIGDVLTVGNNVADVADALASGRLITVRFGDGSATLSVLSRARLGTVANGTLSVPADTHFQDAAFAVVVGTQVYTGGSGLTGVTVFTTPLLGDQVEYGLPGSGIEGQLKFGVDTLADFAASYVYYVQMLTDPTLLSAGSAEVDPVSGEINLSSADRTLYAGVPVYFVEQMVTEDRKDVAIAPLSGSIAFRRPLREMQRVEVSYYQADVSGNQVGGLITEFLPLYVRQELATPVSTTVYAFNPSGRTIREDITPQIWVDNRLQNFGNTVNATVDADAGVIRFALPIAVAAVVRIDYAVLETFGGEQGFTVSTVPVWRPPFFLLADASTFSLETDRTSDMVPGKLLRVGALPVYVQDVTYDGTSDTTTVTIFPTPDAEAGSRAPGNDVLTLLSSVPVTTSVNGTSTAGAAGFLLTLSAAYEPVDRGMLSMVFQGDVTRYTQAGHLIEVGGCPFICTGSTFSDNGRTTTVNVTSPFPRGFDPTVDGVKVSARPIYPPDARRFIGLGQVVASETSEVVLFASGAPGRTLIANTDYTLDTSNGNVSLLPPLQAGLQPGEKLFLAHTRLRTLSPFLEDGMVVVPRYHAGYAHVATPDQENGLLGAYLVGTYTFRSPDSFYVRTVSMSEWMQEVAQVAADRVASRTPHGGPVVVSGPPQDNWDFGTVPIESQERELLDQDRAARVFLSVYDTFVQAFEQVNETILGDVVGDRDGKFRFFVGRGKTYAGPGYEDAITGELLSRFVWSQVFEAANQSFGVALSDPLVDPETATQDPTTLVVTGTVMNPWLVDFYVRAQRQFVLNDMDDTVLTDKGRARLEFPFRFEVPGVFEQMWEPSIISRLYPESTLAFTTTYPGLGAGTLPSSPGVYAFLKLIQRPNLLAGQGPAFGSTFGMDIGDVANPALGLITNITGQVKPRARLARARVWAYSATGFPELGGPAKPSVIATPLPLREFPVDDTTGLPDLTQLAAQGGGLPDLTTGDYELSTPAWEGFNAAMQVYPQVAFGRPSGETYAVGYAAGTILDAIGGAFPFTDPVFKGIFVHQRYVGCILTFTDGSGTEISDAQDIIRIAADGVTTLPFEPAYGDTIYVIPPGSSDTSGFSNPPSAEDMTQFAAQMPTLDVGVRERRSSFVDWSLPSIKDPSPFPIKEMVGQRSASPLQPIEAFVEFANTSRDPLEFPALRGQPTNDCGDYTLPYLSTPNTELERLGVVQPTFTSIVQTDGPPVSHTWLAVYPDEIVGNDGSVLSTVSGSTPPATILTSRDLTPVATAGSYTPHSGVGDVRTFDILLVEKGQADVATGAQGILSVGAVTSGTVEPPRFISPTLAGERIRYIFTNAMTHLSTTGLSGVIVEESGGMTTFDISSVGGLFLNDGSGAATGGLNDIVSNARFAFPNNNIVTLEIIDQTTGLVLETVTVQAQDATGGLGTVGGAAITTFNQKIMTVPVIGFVDFVALGGVAPGPVGPFDFAISVNTYVSAVTPLTGSATASVGMDRLTFTETFDLRTVLPRGSVTVGSVSVQGELSVNAVTASGVESCSINHPVAVNGGDPFTFLERDTAALYPVGTFDPSPGSGEGTVKVMAFEGHGNTPLPSTGSFTFSAIPSSDQDETSTILNGTGEVYDTGVAGINPNSIVTIAAANGDLANVVAGDVVVVTTSSVLDATAKAGTYLVRHAVEDPAATGYLEVFGTAYANTDTGWLNTLFPILVSASAGVLTLSSVQSVPTSPSTHEWASAGRIYLFVSTGDITQTLSREYVSVVVNVDGTATFTLDTTNTTGLSATGAFVTDAAFDTAAAGAIGQFLSGMQYLPVGHLSPNLPSNNVVGYGSGVSTAGGFVDVTLRSAAGSITFSSGTDLVTSAPGVDELGVSVSDGVTTNTSVGFVAVTTPVYLDVPLYLDMGGVSDMASTVYTTLHPTATAVRCVAPGDSFQTHDGTSTALTGFRAQSGLFLEPSFARPVRDLGDGELKVVDDGNTVLGTDRVGMRSAATFLLPSPEAITFEVRRIRRFHAVLDAIGADLGPLRYAYEIRTGTVASYAGYLLTASGTGTQLGGFDDADVNVHAGDMVRLLDGSGSVVDTAEIASVLGAASVLLRSPGFAVSPPTGGETFQVYLRQAPVPHEQSNAQLLDLITDQVILVRARDPVGDTGGRADTVNEFRDNGIADFSTLDPAPMVGDIVLVDPAGQLAGPTGVASPLEYGSRPFGDQSVSTRADGSHIAGGPSELDDNRGWYRIVSDPAGTVSYLSVSGETEFSGADGTPVFFGATAPTNQQFAVLPDITGSGLTGTTEGQMDFRPTHVADGNNSYQDGSFKSVEPISYRIIRPTSLVSEETVDLVLFMRERMLSWVEELRTAMDSDKQGSYYVFQRDQHVADLGSATDGDDGLGVPSNVYISGLAGLTQYAPFANTSDCLSVLDRRFWCLDERLDRSFPPYSLGLDPYSSFVEDQSASGYTVGSGRPVQPDRVTEVLDQTDKLRAQRYAWIKFRANQVDGTLPSIKRFAQELPRLLQEQADLLRLQKSFKDAE